MLTLAVLDGMMQETERCLDHAGLRVVEGGGCISGSALEVEVMILSRSTIQLPRRRHSIPPVAL